MFNLKPDERLHRWLEFRKGLDHLSLEQALEKTVEFWRTCPFTPFYLDPDKLNEWPDPWTLVEENWYCDIAKALGLLYTIKFTKHNPEVEIHIYNEPATGYDYNLVWIDQGKYILNLTDTGVVNKMLVKEEWILKYKFSSVDLKLQNY